jgi:hypothetical protein
MNNDFLNSNFCLFYSYCNLTHSRTTITTETVISKYLPYLFQGHLLCAGKRETKLGSCKGDSGGPLMYYDYSRNGYVQIATVHGAIRGDQEHNYWQTFLSVFSIIDNVDLIDLKF